MKSVETTPDSEARGPTKNWLTDTNILPRVSVVIPMYNEAEHIGACLEAVLKQEHPHGKLEIHVVDGASEDRSAELVQERFIATGAPVTLHHNADRKTAQSLNLGIRAATGDIVIILGAHTEICPGFIQLNIENLRRPEVACSGGTQVNVGLSRKQASIGAAMEHPFGMATAPYRYRKSPGVVHTVVYGAYPRQIFKRVGYFEEEGSIAEDADLNLRIIQAGYKIYFDPRIKTKYYPRRTLRALSRQMFQYGIFRAYLLRKHRQGISWLHLIPPAFILGLVVLTGLAVQLQPARPALVALAGSYLILALFFGITASVGKSQANPFLVAMSYPTMHMSWGAGFLWGLCLPKTHFKAYVD